MSEPPQAIASRYRALLDQIADTAARAGRSPEAVKLLVVTKTRSEQEIRAVVDAGASFLGENYIESLAQKRSQFSLSRPPAWHLIGHLQSRKAPLAAQSADGFHALDSLKLAARLDRFCGEAGRRLPVFLEFNVSGEVSKFGFSASDPICWENLLPEIEAILKLHNLQIQGLMTMAPYSENPEEARPYFQRLRALGEYLARQFPGAHWSELSMGMSGDFLVAIEEGATWVRIGQAIFSPKD
jgi:hypothetical protein